jgi:two-component system nitrate/nitrite response regulator NarL
VEGIVISVVLIAPVRAYCDALATVIGAESDLQVVACVSTASDALACLSSRQPTAALLDFSVESLVIVMPSLRRTSPSTHLIGIGISTQRQAEAVIRGAEEGLAGFVDADQPISDLAGAVRLAVRGESSCSPRIAALLLQALQRRPAPPAMPRGDVAPAYRTLTPRELVVAELAGLGLTNRQIASRLVLGESTVKSHLHSVLRKLGLNSRNQIALGRQLSPPGRDGDDIPPPPPISIASPHA